MSIDPSSLDLLCVNTIRTLSMDAVQAAKSGHPGAPMGFAAPAYVLWTKFLRHDPADPAWPDRDRFVLSAGHASMLLYSLLHLTGYDVSLDDLKAFRQWVSKTPGHPERHVTPGVEVTTGPLGQGFANGVGLAVAESFLAATFNRDGEPIVDHYTYGIVSDGDLMEGVSYEAASLAGHLGLGKLIYLYDQNSISLAGTTNLAFREDVAARFRAAGWHVASVADGNDIDAVEKAIAEARAEVGRPSLLCIRSHIGYGSPSKQDNFEAHGSPLGDDEVARAKERLAWPYRDPFTVPDEALAVFRRARADGAAQSAAWRVRFESWAAAHVDLAAAWRVAFAGGLPEEWDEDIPWFSPSEKIATRAAAGKALTAIAARVPTLIGGSADLNPSTNTAVKGSGDFQNPAVSFAGAQGLSGGPIGYGGRNVHYGVREHAMGSISNGIAAHGGVRPYTATFLQFSDYLRPAVRLAALSEYPVIHVFTHDSIFLGEDGPTHQPVEHIASLRAIPNTIVIRPADANEAAEAWRVAMRHQHGPVALILSRQALPVFDRSSMGPATDLAKGGYTLLDAEGGEPDVLLIATGSEVALCVDARDLLANEGIRARVVSLPSWELFEAQEASYRDAVLPPDVRRRVVVEAASPLGWERFAGENGKILAVRQFGASAPQSEIAKRYGFTPERVAEAARRLVQGGE